MNAFFWTMFFLGCGYTVLALFIGWWVLIATVGQWMEKNYGDGAKFWATLGGLFWRIVKEDK